MNAEIVHPALVDGMRERMQRVLEEKGWSQRRWAREAGIAETHVRLIMERLRNEPERPTVELWVVARLADVAGYSLDWLAYGRGSPQAAEYEDDPVYPSRAHAIAACRAMGLPQAAIDRLRAIAGLPMDPGVEFWMGQALALGRPQATLLLPSSTVPAAPPKPKPERRKRRAKG